MWRWGSSSSALITGPTRLNPRGPAQTMHVETPTLDDASLSKSLAQQGQPAAPRRPCALLGLPLLAPADPVTRSAPRPECAKQQLPNWSCPVFDDTWTLPVVSRGTGSGTQNSAALSRGVSPQGDPPSPAWGQASAQLRSALLRSRTTGWRRCPSRDGPGLLSGAAGDQSSSQNLVAGPATEENCCRPVGG